jgi:hypothetical protein
LKIFDFYVFFFIFAIFSTFPNFFKLRFNLNSGDIDLSTLVLSNLTKTAITLASGCINLENASLTVTLPSPSHSPSPSPSPGFVLINASCILGKFEHVTLPQGSCGKNYQIKYVETSVVLFSTDSGTALTFECNPQILGGIIAAGILVIILVILAVIILRVKSARKIFFPHRDKVRRTNASIASS